MKLKQLSIYGWFFVLISLISFIFISKYEAYNLGLLVFLISAFLFSSLTSSSYSKYVLIFARMLVGAVFIFSGTVKGIDPLGTQYRIEDYLYAYNMHWAVSLALGLSILLNLVEFAIGVMLFFNLRIKLASLGALLMMLIFTPVTLYDALYSPVPDCGCFGDALVISNWQTFYKNIILDSLVIVIFIQRQRIKTLLSIKWQYVVISLILLCFGVFEIYSVRHLPLIDFRPWKIGNRLVPEKIVPVKFYLTYKNKKSGELKEYLSSELPWQDSVFMADWKYDSTREMDPNKEDSKTFPMLDTANTDMAFSIVNSQDYTFLVPVHHISKAEVRSFQKLDLLLEKLAEKGFRIVILSSDPPSEVQQFYTKNNLQFFEIFASDDTSLKMALRSNPGLIVVKKGIVKANFHWRDMPSFEELAKNLDIK